MEKTLKKTEEHWKMPIIIMFQIYSFPFLHNVSFQEHNIYAPKSWSGFPLARPGSPFIGGYYIPYLQKESQQDVR